MSDSIHYGAVMEHLLWGRDPKEQGVYLGQSVFGDLPIVLPLRTFFVHGSIRGATDSGKTLQEMRMHYQLCALQAPSRIDALRRLGIKAEEYSIVCIDHKGDPALFNHSRICAEIGGMEFRHFDTRAGHESYLYNPLDQSHHEHMSRLQRAQEVANALGFIYGVGWSKEFFGSKNVELTFIPFNSVRPDGSPRFRTFRELAYVYSEPRLFAALPGARLDNLKEGSHVVTTMKLLASVHAMNLTPDMEPDRAALFEHAIDAKSLFYRKQFVHLTVPFSTDPLVGPHVTRSFAYNLFNAGQYAKDRKYRVVLFVDEAQHAISRPFIQLFEQARGFGITVALIHQHRGQLANIDGEDQRLAIDTNTAWSLDFDAASEEMIRFIQELSPRGKFARPAWSRRASDVRSLEAWDDYSFAKALAQSESINFAASSEPLLDQGTILGLNARGDVGWVRVRVHRGNMRFVGVVPFYWRYHLTEEQYRKLTRITPPGPGEKTITVKKEPFDDLPPPAIDFAPKSSIVPKPRGGVK
jgi:hypothetical protein